MTQPSDSLRVLAAALLKCLPEEILAARLTPDGELSVISPSGRKMVFTAGQVENARAAAVPSAAGTRPARPAGRKRSAP